MYIKNLNINNLHRIEEINEIPFITVKEGTYVENASLSDISQENQLNKPIPLIHNQGEINKIYLYNIETNGDELFKNDGKINNIVEN